MTRKLADVDSMSMDDISSIIGRGPVVDLSWLAVDEEEYRENAAVPHQNLDMIPELSKALSMEPDGVPSRLPYKDILLTNSNPLDKPVEVYQDTKELIRRVSSYLYQGLSNADIYSKTASEFGQKTVDVNKNKIDSLLSERGLLGNVYINASDFKKCVDSKKTNEFVKRYAKKSLYVVQDEKCDGCVKNINGRCASFGKFVVPEVNYNSQLLNHYLPELQSTGRLASEAGSVKDILRLSFNAPENKPNRDYGVSLWTQTKQSSVKVTDDDIKNFVERSKLASNEVSLEFLAASKKLMLNKTSSAYLLQNPDPEIRKLAAYEGLLGTYIFDMDALGGCAKTASYLKEKGIKRGLYLIRRNATCSYCRCSKGGPCEQLSKSFKITSSLPSITIQDYETMILDKVANNVMHRADGVEAIKRFARCNEDQRLTVTKRTASLVQPLSERRDYGYKTEVAYSGGDVVDDSYNGEEIATFLSARMNEGVFGDDLNRTASLRYSSTHLAKFNKENPGFTVNDGIQGFYFLDPSVYKDYGRGCKIGSTKFRGRGAENIRIASACNGCSKQTSPGWCSAYAKPLIASVDPRIASKYSKKISLPVYKTVAHEDISDKFELRSELPMDLGKPRRKWDPTI